MGHVRLSGPADIRPEAFADLVRAAVQLNITKGDPTRPASGQHLTVPRSLPRSRSLDHGERSHDAPTALLIRGRRRPGQRDALRALYEQHLGPRALANAEQPLVVWGADAAAADAFLVFEVYAGPEAMQAISQAPWFWEYMSQAQPILDGQPEVVNAVSG